MYASSHLHFLYSTLYKTVVLAKAKYILLTLRQMVFCSDVSIKYSRVGNIHDMQARIPKSPQISD